jgi:transcriptional regulator NrdR family protein
MNCTHCGHERTEVTLVRHPEAFVVRRTRRCLSCLKSFATYEVDAKGWKRRDGKRPLSREQALASQIKRNNRDAEIVARVKAGEKRYLLAEEYQLAPNSISHICKRAGLEPFERFTCKTTSTS